MDMFRLFVQMLREVARLNIRTFAKGHQSQDNQTASEVQWSTHYGERSKNLEGLLRDFHSR